MITEAILKMVWLELGGLVANQIWHLHYILHTHDKQDLCSRYGTGCEQRTHLKITQNRAKFHNQDAIMLMVCELSITTCAHVWRTGPANV